MPTKVLNNIQVVVNGADLSGVCNEATLNYTTEMLDETCFGDTTRVRRGGLSTFELNLKGFLTEPATGLSTGAESLAAVMGSSGTIFTVIVATSTTGLLTGYAGRGTVSNYELGGAVGTILPFTATLTAVGVVA